jgi:Anthranilate phosphoribosyltransferase
LEFPPKTPACQEPNLSELIGGDRIFNAIAIKEMLGGKLPPSRFIVLLNSAAPLLVAEKTNILKEGIQMAEGIY